jgi:hypothetical protein
MTRLSAIESTIKLTELNAKFMKVNPSVLKLEDLRALVYEYCQLAEILTQDTNKKLFKETQKLYLTIKECLDISNTAIIPQRKSSDASPVSGIETAANSEVETAFNSEVETAANSEVETAANSEVETDSFDNIPPLISAVAVEDNETDLNTAFNSEDKEPTSNTVPSMNQSFYAYKPIVKKSIGIATGAAAVSAISLGVVSIINPNFVSMIAAKMLVSTIPLIGIISASIFLAVFLASMIAQKIENRSVTPTA